MNRLKFGDVIDLTIGGGWGKEEPEDGLIASYVIRGADFPDVTTGNTESLPLRYEKMSSVAKRSLVADDIILEISGGTKERPTGRTVRVSKTIIDSSPHPIIPASFCRLIRPNKDIVSPRWLYYYLQHWWNEGGTWEYQNQSTGISNFQFKLFSEKFYITLPTLPEQHAIAEVLSALDEKIAASSQIISSGLHLIDAIYLRTPKHRSESIFEEVATVKGGATPSTKVDEFWNGPHNWATPSDITALDGPWLSSTDRKITDSGLQKITSDLYPSGSILMTSRASIGHYAIAAEPTAVNQGFIVLNAHDSALQPWLFAQLRHRTSEFIAWANGATFLELPKGVFKKLPVDLPEARLDEYAAKVNPLLDRIRTAQQESRALAATRDELLPLLMSGKITVADAEKRIAE